MKKSKVIALALAVGIMLMGAGYAEWVSDVKIDNTIETGELAVEIQGVKSNVKVNEVNDVSDFPYNYWHNYMESYDNIQVAVPSVKKNTASFQFENLFPGTKAIVGLQAKNTGTMIASVKHVSVQYDTLSLGGDGSKDLEAAMMVNYFFVIRNDEGMLTTPIKGRCSLAELQTRLNDELQGQVLYPDYELITWDDTVNANNIFRFEIPYDSLHGNEGENEKLNIKIDFEFGQDNLNVPLG
ncbi:hypothetical protein [Clostridium sp. DL1XJH146]